MKGVEKNEKRKAHKNNDLEKIAARQTDSESSKQHKGEEEKYTQLGRNGTKEKSGCIK